MVSLYRRAPWRSKHLGQLTGAGVLPVFVDEATGRVLLLLGQETFVKNWSGSMQWSAFSGASKPGETEREAAAREFFEETLGVFGGDSTSTEEDLQDYAVRVISCRDHKSHTFRRVLFVKQFPFDVHLERRFNERRARLSALEEAARTVEALSDTFPQRYPFVKEGHKLGADVVERVLSSEVQHTTLRVHMVLTSGALCKLTFMAPKEDFEVIRLYADWVRRRNQLLEALFDPEVLREAVDVRWCRGGVPAHVKVRSDFLEKRAVRLIGLKDAQQLVRTKALDGDSIRPSFLPSLRAVCEELASCQD